MTTMTRYDFSKKDFVTLRNELISRIPTYTPNWSDFNQGDIGITLLELFCYVGDQLLFYLDQQTNECFLSTSRLRKDVINICKLIGYELDSVTSAVTDLQFTLEAAHARNVILPQFTRVNGAGGNFVLVENFFIPAGETTLTVQGVEGVVSTYTVTSTGLPDQMYVLNSTSIATGRIYVFVDGVEWEMVENFLDSEDDSEHFFIRYRYDDKYQVEFGDGDHGKVPALGASIDISYIVSSGTEGNAGTGTITSIVDTIYDSNGDVVNDIGVSNTSLSRGGTDRETIEHAKEQAPIELKTLWRMVTLADYTNLISGYPGVLQAKCYDINDYPTIDDNTLPPFREVAAYVIPTGGGPMPTTFRDDLEAFLTERAIIGNLFEIRDVDYVSIDIACGFYLYLGYDETAVKAAIVTALEGYISIDNLEIGEIVAHSRITALIQNVPGVAYISTLYPDYNYTTKHDQIAELGDVDLTVVGVV